MAELVSAEMVANVHSVEVSAGQRVDAGATLVVLESMKMEIPVIAEDGGTLVELLVAEGESVSEGQSVAILDE